MKRTTLLFASQAVVISLSAQFTIFNSSTSGITDNNCWYVNQDASQRVWVATQNSGAFVFNGLGWINYNTSNSGVAANYVSPIVFDQTGDVWLGTYLSNGGVSRFDGTNWTTYHPGNSPLPDYSSASIAIDNSNTKWISTRFGGLAKFDGTNWTVYNQFNSGLPSDQIYAVECDNAGNVWVGMPFAGLAKFDGTTWTYHNTFLPSPTVYTLKFNHVTGRLWVGTDGGAAEFDGTTWTVYTVQNSGLISNYVRGIDFAHATGETWFATGYKGISRLNGTTWTSYHTGNTNLPVNGVWAIKVQQSHTGPYQVWAATMGGGLVNLSSTAVTAISDQEFSATVQPFPNPANEQITIEVADSRGRLSRISIIDQLGRVVRSEEFNATLQLGTASLENGCYHYKITTGGALSGKGTLVVDHR
jgi:hypothetical protein